MELRSNNKTNNPNKILNNPPKRNTTRSPTLLRFNLSIAQRILNKSAVAGFGRSPLDIYGIYGIYIYGIYGIYGIYVI